MSPRFDVIPKGPRGLISPSSSPCLLFTPLSPACKINHPQAPNPSVTHCTPSFPLLDSLKMIWPTATDPSPPPRLLDGFQLVEVVLVSVADPPGFGFREAVLLTVCATGV